MRRLALVALLSGCAAGPDYERPASPLPADHGALDRAGVSLAGAWWAELGDPVLSSLVERALVANRDLVAAAARVDQALALLGRIEAEGLPGVEASAESSRIRTSTDLAAPPPPGAPRLRSDTTAGLSLAYEIDLWGRARRARESAEASLDAGIESLRAAELSVSSLTVATYVSLRAAEAARVALADAAEAREEALRVSRERATAGLAPAGEVERAEVALADAHRRTAEARRGEEQLAHQLASLVGEPSLSLPPATRPLRSPPAPAAGLPSDLLERRPDVRAAEARLRAANAEIGVAQASRFPRLSLTAGVGTASKELERLFEAPSSTNRVGVTLGYDLLDWGAAARATEAARAAARGAAADYERAALEALREVRDALVDLREVEAMRELTVRRRKAADALFAQAKARQVTGVSSPLDWAEARVAHADAVASDAASRRDRILAHVQLIKALGGGW